MSDRAGVYVHVPFCARVCPYCDFAVEIDARTAHGSYVSALLTEIAATPEDPGPVDTVYFGGGTPSLLEIDDLATILFALSERWSLANDTWITLEANPEDVTERTVSEWAALGIRTISLGVQSFDDEELRFLGRRHRASEAAGAARRIRAGGIPVLSIDLIFGLPGQSHERWDANLRAAIELEPEHVSCYQLTVHEGTRFGDRRDRGLLVEMVDGTQAERYRIAHERLAAAGWEGYEVSNFAAAPRYRSRHNSKYWRHVPYLGLGPSAHSLLDRERWWNDPGRTTWEARIRNGELPRAGRERLDAASMALEKFLLGLRTSDGIDPIAIGRETGLDVAALNRERFERWVRQGLVRREGRRLRPTPAGMAVAESMAREVEIPTGDEGHRDGR